MSLIEFAERRSKDHNQTPFVPIWANNAHKSDAGVQKWFEEHLIRFEEFAKYSIEDAWSNQLWYTGEYITPGPLKVRSSDGRDVEIPRQLSPFVINILSNLTDKRAADLSVFKPNHQTKPEDESEEDRMTARVMKPVIEQIKRFNEAERLFDRAEKWNMVYGSMFVGVDWNKKLGDLVPVKKNKTKAKDSKPTDREGEVELRLIEPWFILPWPSRHWDRCPMVIEILEVLHVEEARKKYNNANIKPYGEDSLYGFTSPFKEDIRPDEVVIYRIVYRPDEYLPEGAEILLANRDGMVLKRNISNYPWSHRKLPYVRYTDIDVPGRLFPMSFYNHVKPIQHTYNNLAGMLRKYIYTMAHPKWTMVRGACNIKSLGNAASIIQHRAGQPPTMQTVKSIGADPFNFLSVVEDKMVQLSNSHRIGLGDLPPNTRSGIMISRLREIEAAQRGPQIDKRNEFMKDVLIMAAAVARDHYPLQSDDRLGRVVGKAMVPDLKRLKNKNIAARYAVEIVNPSGFSAELTGRLEEVAFINENIDPTLLTKQQKLDIIGAGVTSKHYDSATAALRAAEGENEDMSNGIQVAQPEVHEDHFQHWNNHMIDIQDRQFKTLPKKIQKMKIDHIRSHEELMFEVGFNEDGTPKNPIYIQQLAQLNGFPRFYEPPKPPAPTEEEVAAQQDANAVANGEVPPSEAPPPEAVAVAPAGETKEILLEGPDGAVRRGLITTRPAG